MTEKAAAWRERIATRRASDQSAAAFYRSQGLADAQFVYWQRRLGDETAGFVMMLFAITFDESLETVAFQRAFAAVSRAGMAPSSYSARRRRAGCEATIPAGTGFPELASSPQLRSADFRTPSLPHCPMQGKARRGVRSRWTSSLPTGRHESPAAPTARRARRFQYAGCADRGRGPGSRPVRAWRGRAPTGRPPDRPRAW